MANRRDMFRYCRQPREHLCISEKTWANLIQTYSKTRLGELIFFFSILPSSCSGRPNQQSMWIKLPFGFKDWDALKLPRRCAKYVSSERQSFPRLLVSRSHEELTMPRRAQLLEVVQSFLVMGINYWCMFKAPKSFSSVFAVWHVKKIGGLFFWGGGGPFDGTLNAWFIAKCHVGQKNVGPACPKLGLKHGVWMFVLFFVEWRSCFSLASRMIGPKPWNSAFANPTFQRNFGLKILKTTTKECDKDDEDFRIAIHISQVENHCCSRSSSPRVLTVFVRWSYTKMFVAHCSLFVFNCQFLSWCPGWCVALYVSWTTMAVACCDVSKKDCRTTLCFHHLFIHCGSVKMWTFRSRKKMVNCKRWMWPQPVLLSRRSDRNWTIRWIRWGSWKEIEDLRANVLHLEAFIVCRPGPPEVEDHLMNPWCVENGICHQVIVLTRNMMISWSFYQWISRSPKFRQIHVEFCVNHVPKRSHHIFKNIFLGDGSATFNCKHPETTCVYRKIAGFLGEMVRWQRMIHIFGWVGSCLTHGSDLRWFSSLINHISQFF